MNFNSSLQPATLIKRYKRFLADFELPDGTVVTAHCPNTGAMTGCAEPGYDAWLSKSDSPKRKLAYTWELAQNDAGHMIGINTHRANRLVEEAIVHRRIPQLSDYPSLLREQKYGAEGSKIDFLLHGANLPDCYVEVKSVTLLEQGQGYFPDTKTVRGTRHLRELAAIAAGGERAVLLFCVQHTGITTVSPAAHLDPDYTGTLHDAVQAGVEIYAFNCMINEQKIELNQRLKFIC